MWWGNWKATLRLSAWVELPWTVSKAFAPRMELMELEQEGYLSAYGVPSAAAAEDDPSCCLLTVSFTPARNIVTVQATLVVQI